MAEDIAVNILLAGDSAMKYIGDGRYGIKHIDPDIAMLVAGNAICIE
jgi:hypothetical protein